MAEINNSGHSLPAHFVKKSRDEYEFHELASEIAILNGRGRVVWRKQKSSTNERIRWRGIDSMGSPVDEGSYTCKILYSHLSQAVYLPFVFMR